MTVAVTRPVRNAVSSERVTIEPFGVGSSLAIEDCRCYICLNDHCFNLDLFVRDIAATPSYLVPVFYQPFVPITMISSWFFPLKNKFGNRLLNWEKPNQMHEEFIHLTSRHFVDKVF
jgi:hypothetical protein